MAEFIVAEENREMFEVFCGLHPVEAYDLNKEEFIKYARKRLPNASIDIIESLIEEERKLSLNTK